MHAIEHDARTGAELIAAERQRQIDVEGWTPEHDDAHDDGSLALAAICYAAPEQLFVQRNTALGVSFFDPWPDSWDDRWDKRRSYGDGPDAQIGIADPGTYSDEEQLDLLVKAGALFAAEIDRRLRAARMAPWAIYHCDDCQYIVARGEAEAKRCQKEECGEEPQSVDTSAGYLDMPVETADVESGAPSQKLPAREYVERELAAGKTLPFILCFDPD
jgi:hypothetical protein